MWGWPASYRPGNPHLSELQWGVGEAAGAGPGCSPCTELIQEQHNPEVPFGSTACQAPAGQPPPPRTDLQTSARASSAGDQELPVPLQEALCTLPVSIGGALENDQLSTPWLPFVCSQGLAKGWGKMRLFSVVSNNAQVRSRPLWRCTVFCVCPQTQHLWTLLLPSLPLSKSRYLSWKGPPGGSGSEVRLPRRSPLCQALRPAPFQS